MTTQRSDVLVLGSSLGGLVAATYLARAGLRVVLVEEECLGKRPPLLREPFALSGLESDGPVHRVMRELALPLIEQRRVAQTEVALQVLLPRARVELHAGRREAARELEAYQLCDPEAARVYLEAADLRGDELRARLLEGDPGEAEAPLVQRWLGRATRGTSPDPGLGPVPEGLGPVDDAITTALSRLAPAPRSVGMRPAAAQHARGRPSARRGHALPRPVPPPLRGAARGDPCHGRVRAGHGARRAGIERRAAG
jgi:hypothetical protein